MYYECLQEFQREITDGIIQTDINVDRLTDMARQSGLIFSGYYMRPDSGKHFVSRESKIITFVSRCIESVKRNGDLFRTFLALLEEAGLQHLVRRIRKRLEQGGDLKSKVPLPSDDSAISISVSSNSHSLPPLPPIPTTFSSLQSPTHNVGMSSQPDQKKSRSAFKRSSRSVSDYEAEKEPSLQPLTSPTHSGMSIRPVEETQESNTEDLVASRMQPRLHHSEGFQKQQAKGESSTVETQIQKLINEKQELEKNLETELKKLNADHQLIDKQNKEQIRRLQRQVGKDQKELESLRTRTAKLERELEKRDKDNEKLRKFFSDREQQIQQNHEREVENLRKQLSEEREKAEKKEIEIKELNNRLLQKELEKMKILGEYKDKERALQRERDNLKVELAQLHQKMMEKDYEDLIQEWQMMLAVQT